MHSPPNAPTRPTTYTYTIHIVNRYTHQSHPKLTELHTNKPRLWIPPRRAQIRNERFSLIIHSMWEPARVLYMYIWWFWFMSAATFHCWADAYGISCHLADWLGGGMDDDPVEAAREICTFDEARRFVGGGWDSEFLVAWWIIYGNSWKYYSCCEIFFNWS